jgi:KDO2-lipid IV(A) lauroyltransferase
VDRYSWFRIGQSLATWPRPIAYWLSDRGGDLSCILDRSKREAIYANLRVVLGPEAANSEIRRVAKQLFRNFSVYLGEFLGPVTFGGDFMFRHVRTVNFEHVDRAVARGRGAVFLTAHLSNWEMGAAALASRGYRVFGVAQEHDDPRLVRLFGRMRLARGYTTIPPEGAFRRCVEALREGTSVCFVADRDVGEASVEVEFFGRPTPFPVGPARIALAADATIVPGFIIRQPNRDLTVTAEPPVEPPAGGSQKHKALVMTQRFANLVERYVRAYPEQWGVFHKVWDEAGPLNSPDLA